VNCVINYDIPDSAVSYIHRVGRTGRAGRHGTAITLFTEIDKILLRNIANIIKLSGGSVPDWMLTLERLPHNKEREIKQLGIPRPPISTLAKEEHKQDKQRQKFKKMKRLKRQKQNAPTNQ